MLDFLELEETVGRAWHGWSAATASYPVHAGACGRRWPRCRASSRSCSVRFGGEAGVQIAGANARKSGHRLGWRQRIGLGDERLEQPGRDGATVFLPDRIAFFPDRELNAALYRWLAAWFAIAPVDDDRGGRSAAARPPDPAPRPRDGRDCTGAISRPGRNPTRVLAAATATARPRRPLPRIEQEVEQIVLALLGAGRRPKGGCGRPMIGDGRAAGEGAARLPADPAMPAVGRLLDPRADRCAESDDDAQAPAPSAAAAGHAQALRGPRARGRRQAATRSSSTASRRSSPWPRWSTSTARRRQRGRGRAQGGRRSRRARDRPPQRQAGDQAEVRPRPAARSGRCRAAR